MPRREIPRFNYDNETKNNILDASTKLFALKGYGCVSMRDIAKAVGIKTSSIYYYYESKDALIEDVFSRFEKGYKHYFDWLSDVNSRADTLEEIMENMFNKEFVEMHDPIGCLGMSLVIKEQHNSESARRRVFDLFHKYSIISLKADFDKLIEKGLIPPSDTKTISMIFMFFVMVCNDIRIHEYAGKEQPFDCSEMYNGLKTFITSVLIQGTIQTGEQ